MNNDSFYSYPALAIATLMLTFVLLAATMKTDRFNKNMVMKKTALLAIIIFLCGTFAAAQTKVVKKGKTHDTIIVKHGAKPVKKPAAKLAVQSAPIKEIVLPTPEFINQPYYYDNNKNLLIKLENTTAQLVTKKKTLGLKGAKQFLSMERPSSKVRFTEKKDIVFFIKTSGDVIDLTSYIKLYKFITAEEKREAIISSKEGVLTDKVEEKGKLIDFSVKMISKDNYMIQLSSSLEAGEYGFVWLKNMELKEFNVFTFAIDWKTSD